MQLRSVACAVLLVLSACSGREGERRALEETWDNDQVRVRGEQVMHAGDWVKDGAVSFFNRDGTPRAQGQYTLGLESGEWTEHLDDGTRAVGSYTDGQRDGLWTYFFEDGGKQEEGHFSAGERVGEWTWWYRSGGRRSLSFYVAGKLHGAVQAWTEDGEVDPDNSLTYEHGVAVE